MSRASLALTEHSTWGSALLLHKYTRARTTSREHPILLGPVFLHWDGLKRTYDKLFSHLSRTLDLSGSSIEILFGTDVEKALTSSLENNFPGSKRKLCTKHIKDNLKHHLTDKCPTDPKTRKQIINKIFGPDGVASVESSFQFDQRNDSLINDLQESNHGDFVKYYEKDVKGKLLDHVINHTTCDFWTNNNAESMNNRLKQAIGWKPLKTDELIENIYGVVRVQFVDLRRAMYDSGSFSVSHRYKRLKMNETEWRSKSEEEKKAVFKKFLKAGVLKKPKTVVSTDCKYMK